MLHPRLLILSALPLATVCGPAPADNTAAPAAPAVPPIIFYTPVDAPVVTVPVVPQPTDLHYTEAVPALPGQKPAGPAFPMTVVTVDPKGFPIVVSQGIPGHYPMPLIPVPGGVMAPAPTTVPYAVPYTVAPGGAPVLVFPIRPTQPPK
jgi:hypothetical protein